MCWHFEMGEPHFECGRYRDVFLHFVARTRNSFLAAGEGHGGPLQVEPALYPALLPYVPCVCVCVAKRSLVEGSVSTSMFWA